ncbi:MAG: aminoacetone oxidase family FAD-binding enzyme [Lachnospiraceae bacterium]|nr:aminoacetone oxidase family FAD-binding enzyme [Lachnospiraceae bacterium]
MNKKVAVIGGGAAGMMAAIQASLCGAQVEIYERNSRVGKKLLATGNGKCNFSNLNMDKTAYYGSAVALYDEIYSKFDVQDTIDFFGQRGMLIKNKGGYLYPLSEQAATVLDVLRFGLEEQGILVHTDSIIENIQVKKTDQTNAKAYSKDRRFVIRSKEDSNNNQDKSYDAVIIACGGMAAPKTGSDGNGYKLAASLGHNITETVPALVQLRCNESFFKGVAGVRTDAALKLYIDEKEEASVRGELQLTDYGISGIPVFQFSRLAAYGLLHKRKVTVDIDFLPDYKDDEYKRLWKERWKRQPHQTLEQFLTGISNKKINQLIIKLAGAKPQDMAGDVNAAVRSKIESLYRQLTVSVCATNGFENAQVSAGGIPAEELTGDLESKLIPNLYFAGEIVDIDGICGGYNLQWAWSSGAIAGRTAATKQ